ncbi:MAG: SH3 domain-containing protein [bacterium]|nr:MAG: SH3 domain-containing protein [bacterium]
MRTQTFHFVLWLLLITMLACGPEFIDQQDRIKITTESNVHSGPGPTYKVITTVKAGSELVLLESENDWHRVRLSDGRTGWIFSGVAKTIAPEKIIMIEDARIRRGPGEEYRAFAIIKKGKTLDARGQRGNWFLVDLPDGQSGWISKTQAEKVSYRNLTADQKSKIYQLPNPNSPVLLNVDSGTELIQLNKQGEYYMVRLPGGDTGWIHEDYVNTIKEKTLLVKERAYIRYGPTIEYEVVEVVEKGTRLTLLSQKGDWYEVRTPQGNTGWIYKQFLVQTWAATTQDVTVEEVPLYLVTNTDCNIRQGYGTNWEIIARVKKGTILVKIGQRDNWLRIRMPDQKIGWIREDLVDYNPSILVTLDKCNIRLGPSTDFRIKTTVPKGTPLAKISEQNGWSRIYLPDGEIGWIRNDLRADTAESLFTKEDCNVRDGPSTSYQRIDRLKPGTPVIQLDKKDNWYQVKLPSKRIGWIREDLLRDTPNQMITNDRVNIRYGPGTLYRVLAQVEKNTPVTIIGEQDNWYQVKLPDGRIGWIRKDLVSYSYYPTTSESQSAYNTYTALSSSLPGSQPTVASSNKSGVKMVTTSAVNLRMRPGITETKITLIPPGTSVARIDQQGEWYEVRTNDGILGFVHQSGFSIGTDKVYTNAKSNIRFGPSTDYRIVAVMPEKSELTKIEQRDDWVYVKMSGGQKGWIHKDLVDQDKKPAPLPPRKTEAVSGSLITTTETKILKGPDETYPTVKSLKMNTQLKKISQYKDWYEVETLTGDKGWISDKFVSEKDSKKIIVIRKSEVHEAPDTQSGLITMVDVGQYYTPLNQEGGWYRIQVKPGIAGWIISRDMMELKYPSVYVNTSTADIMKFADDKSNKLAIVKEGVQLTPIDETDDWLFIQLPRGDKGWIKKNLVNRQKYPRIRIVKDTEAYEQPNAGSLLRARMVKNDEFLALDKKENWYKILLRGSEVGWVYSGYVKEITRGSLLVKENSYLRMGPGLDYRIITTIPGGQQVNWIDQKGDWNQVQISSGEVGWIYEELAKDVTMPTMTAQSSSLVYAGPGTNFAKVGEIGRGRKYSPIKKQDGWYQIRLSSGTEGWVSMNIFSLSKSRLVFTLDKANIRNGPGLHYSIIQTLQPAVDVTVIGSEGDWYHVQLQDGTRGYIRKDLVFEE